jgi:Cft2 family RNA processing exonuclease
MSTPVPKRFKKFKNQKENKDKNKKSIISHLYQLQGERLVLHLPPISNQETNKTFFGKERKAGKKEDVTLKIGI